MYDFTQDIPPEKSSELIEKIAKEVVKRRLEIPAILFLEMHKPLTYIASQGVVVFSPFMAPFFGYDNVLLASKLMEKRENVENLICRIEEISANQNRSSSAPTEQSS
jgi:hypothetical protein